MMIAYIKSENACERKSLSTEFPGPFDEKHQKLAVWVVLMLCDEFPILSFKHFPCPFVRLFPYPFTAVESFSGTHTSPFQFMAGDGYRITEKTAGDGGTKRIRPAGNPPAVLLCRLTNILTCSMESLPALRFCLLTVSRNDGSV